MHADLQLLIQLQDLDLTAEGIRRRIADMPSVRALLDERLAAATAAVTTVKERLAANQSARREIEKDLAVVQSRLSKYKDQLMEVKTNKEYQAMQTEIHTAEQHVRGHEDRLLERMEETDALTAELKHAESALAAAKTDVAREHEALERELTTLHSELERITADRRRVTSALSSHALALFDHVSRRRRGIALSEAREGHCLQCHVRLRPQVFNDVRRNDALIQCESCSRILYFVPPVPAADAAHSS